VELASPAGTELFPNLGGSITTQDNRGKSDYHACGAIDTCQPQLYTDFKIERGLSNQDQPYRLVLSSLYELPFGKGKRWAGNISRPLDFVIGGLQLNGIYVLQAGQPFSVTVDDSPSSTRADVTGSIDVNPGSLTNYIKEIFSSSNTPMGPFTIPASAGGVFIAPGTSGRDILRGPGSSNINLSLFKNFAVTERIKGQFRVQAYTLTNTPHFANPNTDLSQGPNQFGHITSTIPFTIVKWNLAYALRSSRNEMVEAEGSIPPPLVVK
jgi:hypothetical protein